MGRLLRTPVLIRVLAAVSSGLLLALAFPPGEIHAIAWFGMVPLLVALRDRRTLEAFALGTLAGAVFFRLVFSWIGRAQGVTWGDAIVLMVYLGLWVGLFGAAASVVARHTGLPDIVTLPTLWVALEYARANLGFLSLPWAFLGHTQYTILPVIQIASVTGAYGISFLVVLANAAAAELVAAPRRAIRDAVAAAAVVAVAALHGAAVLAQSAPPGDVTVTLVHADITQRDRWDPRLREHHVERHAELTRQAMRQGRTDLIVWPETAVPGRLTDDVPLATRLGALAHEASASLLVGSAVRPKFGPRELRQTGLTNSAFLFSPAGMLVGHYDKIRLVPFGEHLPHAGVLPWPKRVVAAAGRFVPGREQTVFALDRGRFGVLICWEAVFPELARRLVARGSEFLVNMTNEAWFSARGAPRQFLAIVVFRAVENRVAVVRATNGGVSAIIDRSGRIVDRVPEGAADPVDSGTLTADVLRSRIPTFYTRFGDVFASVLVAATAVMLGLSGRAALASGLR